MKILYVVDYFYPYVGGVPTLFINLAKEMVKRGHDVSVITSHIPGTKKSETWNGIHITRVGKDREGFMYQSVVQMLKTSDEFDVIHTSTYSAMIPAFIYSFLKNKSTVLSVHEVWFLKEWIEFTKLKGLFYFLEERTLFTLPFDFYVCPSEHTKKDLMQIGVERRKIEVIQHGIDNKIFNPSMKRYRKSMRRRYGIDEKSIVCSFIGKPTEFKGIRYVLEAMEKVLERTSIKFIFVLSKNYKSEYNSFIEKLNSSKPAKENSIIIDPRSAPDFSAKIISCSDFLIMPSLTEGFGFVAAEALSIGVPIIVTKNTSLVEVVDNNKNGIYVDLRDSEQLANKIISLASNKELLKRLSKPKKFNTWNNVATNYERIYKELTNKH